MEEAGFYNCVSVPDGAPASVSTKVFKSDEEVCVFVFGLIFLICWCILSPSVDNQLFLAKYL